MRPWLGGGAVALLIGLVAALFWPGVAMYDTVAQYGQVLSGDVDDWHPPIMVRLWQLLHPLAPGAAPMFVLQVALYALGFALIVAALVRSGRGRAALAAAVLALSPLVLGWQMVVLKDTQMLGALIAVIGLVAHYRLSARPLPAAAWTAVALLVAYATLFRANAVFATVPLAVLMAPRPASMLRRAVMIAGVTAAVLAVSPLISHRLLGAAPSGVAKSQPLFDLAAIAVATAPSAPSPFTAAERAQIAARHCVKHFFWDPLGDPGACGPVTERLNGQSEGAIFVDLARAVAAHPLTYAAVRLRHWNSTERWIVPPGLIDGGPPDEAEPNNVGLATPPGPFVPRWQAAAGVEAATPLGWPISWTIIALLLLPVAWRRRSDPTGSFAMALLVSALALEASFLVVSIASDLRYHLWPMAASALALILLSHDLRLTRRAWAARVLLVGLVIGAGTLSRASLPRAPDTYHGMIHAASG